jgi:hypothetical protein
MSPIALALALAVPPAEADTSYLYRALMLRAAPGAFVEVLEQWRARLPVLEAAGERPVILRHRQGDHWDLMLLFPMESFTAYYGADQAATRRAAAEASGRSDAAFQRAMDSLTAWREEVFVLGPTLDVVREAFAGGTFFHVEMFLALPEKRDALIREREMENDYQEALGRPRTMIFRRVAGAAWDLFTIGVYADQPTWASSDLIPAERRDAAARGAGFSSADAIGPYLRSLVASHHDTLGSVVR